MQTTQQAARLAFGNTQPRTGKCCGNGSIKCGSRYGPSDAGTPSRNSPPKATAHRTRDLLQMFGRSEHGVDLLQQLMTASGRHDAPTTALEQWRSERLLHFLHLMRESRRADVHGPRGTVETAVLMHGLHQRKIAQRDGGKVIEIIERCMSSKAFVCGGHRAHPVRRSSATSVGAVYSSYPFSGAPGTHDLRSIGRDHPAFGR
jgi:hypothetical protein